MMQMSSFSLKLIASNKVFFEGRCEILILPGIDGEQAIMAHHEEMVIAVKEGEGRFKKEDGTWQEVVLGIGFAYVANNRVTMLVDTAERPEDIDEVRAKEALERAKEQMRQRRSIREYKMSQASMARALSRLKVKGIHDV